MTIEKLKRVIWRLKEINAPDNIYTSNQIRRAIMDEIGIDERTLKRTISVMIEYKMIKHAGFGKMEVLFETIET